MINASVRKGRMLVWALVAAFFTSLFAAMPLIISSPVAAQPVNVCITEPSFEAPEGNRWYYQIDRATNRKCWYIASQSRKLQPAASPKTLSPSKAISRAFAQTLPEQLPEQRVATPPAGSANMLGVATLVTGQPGWRVAAASSARWPLAGNSAADPNLKNDPNDETLARALNLTAAESAPSTRSSDQGVATEYMLLLFAGALVFAGIVGRAITKNSAGRRRNRAVPLRRRRPEIGRELREPNARPRARQRNAAFDRPRPAYS
jgi:hypothetical protein